MPLPLPFGLELTRTSKSIKDEKKKESFVLRAESDGSLTVERGAGFFTSTFLDVGGAPGQTDFDHIITYRGLALHPEIDSAIDDIVNEAIVADERKPIIQLNLDNVEFKGVKSVDKIKERIQEEFSHVVRLMRFQTRGHEKFRKWYIDGRLYHHVIVDEADAKKGILEIREIDPLTIRKIREVERELDPKSGIEIPKIVDEYYINNENGFQDASGQGGGSSNNLIAGVRINIDAISFIHSGLIVELPSTRGPANSSAAGRNRSKRVFGYLHKALKPMNQLRLLEDAVVIYRISRAPERRIFYIDVGSLPKVKAEQYLKDIMNRYRNKLVYDATTGEVRDTRRHFSMLEDFWLPRREGGRGTEITTLAGGENLGEMEDVEFFLKKLYKALNVPISRLDPEQGVQGLGRASEITRDELKFSKFVSKIRNKFSELFMSLLRTQVIMKGILTDTDWEQIVEDLHFDWARDSHFAELKDAEILRERLELLGSVNEAVEAGFYSTLWIRKNILRQSDEEIRQIDKEVKKEKKEAEKAENGPDASGGDDDDNGLGFSGSTRFSGESEPEPEPSKEKEKAKANT